MKKNRLMLAGVLLIASIVMNLYLAPALHLFISKQWEGVHQISISNGIHLIASEDKARMLFFALQAICAILVGMILLSRKGRVFESEMADITDKIRTPVAAGQRQHGSAQWLPKAEFGKAFASYTIDPDNPFIKGLMQAGKEDLDFANHNHEPAGQKTSIERP